MHLNLRLQISGSNIPSFPQNTYFPATWCTTCFGNLATNLSRAPSFKWEQDRDGGRKKYWNWKESQGKYRMSASKQLSKPEQSKLKKKIKTPKLENKNKTLHHIHSLPNLLQTVIPPLLEPRLFQTQNQWTNSAGLGHCSPTLASWTQSPHLLCKNQLVDCFRKYTRETQFL